MKNAITFFSAFALAAGTFFGLQVSDSESSGNHVTFYQTHTERSLSDVHRDIKINREATVLGAGDSLFSVMSDIEESDDWETGFYEHHEEIESAIRSADAAVSGLDTGLANQLPDVFLEHVRSLAEAGFSMFSLRGSSSRDARSALVHLDSTGAAYSGIYDTKDGSHAFRKEMINGLTFAFLSFTHTDNEAEPASSGDSLLFSRMEDREMKEAIKTARDQSDIVVLNLHFPQEQQQDPGSYQTAVSTMAAEAGADIIFGHNPDALQPFEWLHTSDGRKVFTAYSLGTISGSGTAQNQSISGLAGVTVKDIEAGPASYIIVDDPVFYPVFFEKTAQGNNSDIITGDFVNGNNDLFSEAEEHVGRWMDDLRSGWD
ncbi:hypothetical protein CR205_06255 [Alteribacter lacisalsi]|uniref:Capsule synthesis protein CapA domain-containing protein n=1 Tax=Alteribacter lacisalsi TaxID=2045244 RepID=A0A2W0H8K0_9BACI|nr:CapA family protein [Alteribacter lacisalsi]PYZ98193.1 hypothetical protein CR205_06255 [Alteribacter lacisalsi]